MGDYLEHYRIAEHQLNEAAKVISTGIMAAREAGVDTLIAKAQVHATLALVGVGKSR